MATYQDLAGNTWDDSSGTPVMVSQGENWSGGDTTTNTTNTPDYTAFQDTFNQEWPNFFNQDPGYSIDWAGGTLSLGEDGNATYMPTLGDNFYQDIAGNWWDNSSGTAVGIDNPAVSLNSGMSWDDVYGAHSDISSSFDTLLANGWTPDQAANNGTDTGINFFQPNLYPTNTSINGSSGSNFSGIDWNSPFMQYLLPFLNNSINALPGLLDSYSQTLQDQQTNAARQMLGPQAFQGTLNDLVQRGMTNSSVAGTAMSNTAQSIMQNILNQGYSSNLAAQNARLGMPSLLGSLANLGQTSYGQSNSAGVSHSSNPLAPFELVSQMLLGLQ